MREDRLDSMAVHASKCSRPGSARGHIVRQRPRTGVEEFGEVSDGRGSRRNQCYTPELGLVQEELYDTTARPSSRKDDGGGPEVGQAPLDVVLDEVDCGRKAVRAGSTRGTHVQRCVPKSEGCYWSQDALSDGGNIGDVGSGLLVGCGPCIPVGDDSHAFSLDVRFRTRPIRRLLTGVRERDANLPCRSVASAEPAGRQAAIR